VTEVLLMTLFACLTGIVLAFVLMILLGMITLNTGDSEMGFFLVSQHLHFVPRAGDLILVPAIILALALLTAYFPARKAANLSVCEALRHYE
jgi:ABC-type lipoprotein release transport system permease subunit